LKKIPKRIDKITNSPAKVVSLHFLIIEVSHPFGGFLQVFPQLAAI